MPTWAEKSASQGGAARTAILALLLAFSLCHPAAADPAEIRDLQQIEDGEPVTLQDDLTNDPGELSIQFSGTYIRSHQTDAKELLEQGTTLKLGVLKDVQFSLNPSYDTGRADGRNSGNLMGDVLLHLVDQTPLLPAFAVDVFYATPFGAGRKSAQYVFRAIASRTLGTSDFAPRLHLNLTDYHLTQPASGERKDQPEIAFGGSFLPTSKGALVADIVYGASDERRGTQTFAEIGYTREVPFGWTLEFGVGKQVSGAANAVRVFLSIETEIHIF